MTYLPTSSLIYRLPLLLLMLKIASPLGVAESGNASILPPLNSSPGPEYADMARMFQGIPGMERAANSRLWATWYGGGTGEDVHNYIMLATSGDDGRTWSSLKLVLDPDGPGPVRAFDPCLWHDPDGKLWLFWAQEVRKETPKLLAITANDSGLADPVWSTPRVLCDGIMMNKPTVLTNGDWLLPTSIWKREESSRVVRSSDRGATWELIGTATIPDAKDRNADENMIVQRKDGNLWMLVRTGYGIGETTSRDGGKTWPDVAPSPIPHLASRFFIRRLSSGKLLLVRHNSPDKKTRSHLTAYLSDDDGVTWTGGLLLDKRNGAAYPDGVQDKDGVIHIIYDFERSKAKQILMASFTEQDVELGKPSATTRLSILVNQATAQIPKKNETASAADQAPPPPGNP